MGATGTAVAVSVLPTTGSPAIDTDWTSAASAAAGSTAATTPITAATAPYRHLVRSSAPSRQSNDFVTGGTHERAACFRGALGETGNGPLGVV